MKIVKIVTEQVKLNKIMGVRVRQTIYTCSLCGNIPEDGTYLWHMGSEMWCKECCDNVANKV